jgi:hypothetical protein
MSPGRESVGSIRKGGVLLAYLSQTNLFEASHPCNLTELLRHIHTREAALPDFQRDAVTMSV